MFTLHDISKILDIWPLVEQKKGNCLILCFSLHDISNIFFNRRFSVFGMMNKVCQGYLYFIFLLTLHIDMIHFSFIQCVTPMGRRLLR
jgi:hypothetical protein